MVTLSRIPADRIPENLWYEEECAVAVTDERLAREVENKLEEMGFTRATCLQGGEEGGFKND